MHSQIHFVEVTSSNQGNSHPLPLKSQYLLPFVFFFMSIRHLDGTRCIHVLRQADTSAPFPKSQNRKVQRRSHDNHAETRSKRHAVCWGRKQCVLPWYSVERHHPEAGNDGSFPLRGDYFLPGLHYLHLWMFSLNNSHSCIDSTLNE